MELFKMFSSNEFSILVTIITAVIAVFMLDFVKRRKRLFYSEEPRDEEEIKVRISLLQNEIQKLKSDISSGVLQNAKELIDREVSEYLENNIERLTEQKLKDTKAIEKEIFREMEKRVIGQIDKFLESKSDKDFAQTKKENDLILKRTKAEEELKQTVEQERRSAGLLKSVMINLFVLANIGLFVMYLVSAQELSNYAVLSISGLYVSLAGFIIYIFKASNSRTSVLLAIQEDLKKQNVAMEYIESLNGKRVLCESDIDLIKMIMVNHSEREKKASHPYEMVFKGVSGSNIQFKGGKMTLGEK